MAIFYAPGDYIGKCEQQAWQKTKSGDPMLVLRCRVVAELQFDEAGVEKRYMLEKNYDRTVRIPFVSSNEQALDFAIDKVQYGCGWIGDDFGQLHLEGEEIRLRCTAGEYKGQKNEQWDVQLPPRESKPLESDENIPRTLNALLGRKLKSAPAAAQAPPPPPEHADDVDDIPF